MSPTPSQEMLIAHPYQQMEQQQEQYLGMSNFDKLYNKRIDWKPLVASQANEQSPLVKGGAQQFLGLSKSHGSQSL